MYVFVNNQLDAQFFFMYVYYYSLHVSGSHVPIIRRINCINTTSVICHSLSVIYTVTYTRYRIDTINSPDDGHMDARNMYRIVINMHAKEMCIRLVNYKDYT